MSDLRTFDAASRGLYGSAGLIWKLRARHFAVPGSLAVILALAFDPFTQNLIHYYPKLVADASETAIVSNNSVYDVVGLKWITGGMTYMDQGLKASIYNAIFNNDEAKPWAIPQYTCTSGNCTWNPITALEIAASCANITDHLKYKCTVIPTFYKGMNYGEESNCSVYLPDEDSNEPADGLFAEFVTNTREGTAVAVGSGGKGVFFEDPFIVPIHLIAADNMLDIKLFTTQTRWQAMECTTSPIVRSFRPAVTRGVYNEETLGVWTNRSINHDFSSGYYLRPPWGIEMGMERNTSFMVGYQSIEMLLNFFVELFAGHANLRAHSGILFAPHEKAIYASTDLVQAVSYFNITGCTVKTAERLRCVMENVALAMSKTFRDNPSVSSPLPYTEGQALTNITYVSVHWQWIILPALVCLLGLTTLLGTIWKTRKAMVPTWKNDAIPLLFLYEITQDEKPENYQKPANNQRMMLKESEGKMLLSD
ncbi:hypothetical protein PENVUL_c027G05686 [Penicillium vulpinum]|uniref:Uncharacterized protein n=2 Tax=Penicillium vulpinum TaxID=29845 RepID=A0A1V6RTY0_9EURO|nr:hypothetical protein PENVUL_c027G05686 [Penicillium vulpinum]